jgi:hypothetical protein
MDATKQAEQHVEKLQAEDKSQRKFTQEELESADATLLRDHSMPGYLYACTSLINKGMTHGGFKGYLDNLLEESGSPHDPIERMMIEQLALAHHNIGRLQVKSSAVDSHQESVAYASAATRLTAEYRRLSAAIQDYRAKARSTLGIVRDETEERIEPERKASFG